MTETFFSLSRADQREALEFARTESGRPAHLLEKDIWVVWTLNALFSSTLHNNLTFKGGTSLSKVYNIIDRFSEDIDLTYDIRKLIPDLIGETGELPASRSQASRWTTEVRHRLPDWIKDHVLPVLQEALAQEQINAHLELTGPSQDKLLLHYPALVEGTGYIKPTITLEFGGRATGEPNEVHTVHCDVATHLPDVSFPSASPRVMSVSRTFWEKATAVHVFCAQGRIRGERYARHWHDLAAIARSPYFDTAIAARDIATAVARHKSLFFIEKDVQGLVIDYINATSGNLSLIPMGEAKTALEKDYAAMQEDQVLLGDGLPFDELLKACAYVETQANQMASQGLL
ncbi:nucleotidyl transferase AbiEii/AbiGii toxin family protein [Alcaligenes sp. SORT26]|uniref:nucleotidyl transferase AbiEii/AbiGii toxin family protein n=1 Tax=Alcaligenes sp. SORT26 TaxID=2813780 RepID=UPI001A9DDD57|nr:nucleotidyl transferase AbiEii/AbiGii toxin family protein [Alcaligenes sp. SORT26]QTB99849.1 nucleotidyl transferase AbiEii/AbiGii toxin family protein [Alcaligenes sp. SORT26]